MNESIGKEAPDLIAAGGTVDKRTVSGKAGHPFNGSAILCELHRVDRKDPDDNSRCQNDETSGEQCRWKWRTVEKGIDIAVGFYWSSFFLGPVHILLRHHPKKSAASDLKCYAPRCSMPRIRELCSWLVLVSATATKLVKKDRSFHQTQFI